MVLERDFPGYPGKSWEKILGFPGTAARISQDICPDNIPGSPGISWDKKVLGNPGISWDYIIIVTHRSRCYEGQDMTLLLVIPGS